MEEQYSIQQLNSHLPEVLKQIEQGNSIEITQKGKSFACILSASEYQRLTASKPSLYRSLQDFRAKHDLEELEKEADLFTDVRDRSLGRKVNF